MIVVCCALRYSSMTLNVTHSSQARISCRSNFQAFSMCSHNLRTCALDRYHNLQIPLERCSESAEVYISSFWCEICRFMSIIFKAFVAILDPLDKPKPRCKCGNTKTERLPLKALTVQRVRCPCIAWALAYNDGFSKKF